MRHIDTIVIGGGISGISFTKELIDTHINSIVFEKNKIGGCIDSQQYQDIWFEMGAHTIYNSYSDTIKFIKKSKLENAIQSRIKLPFLLVKQDNKIQSIFRNINIPSAVFYYIKNRNITKEKITVSQYAKTVFGK